MSIRFWPIKLLFIFVPFWAWLSISVGFDPMSKKKHDFKIINFTHQKLFFSEYIEGIANNKALEIFNPGPFAVNLANFTIYRANNGSLVASDSLLLVGILQPCQTYVVGNPSADAQIINIADTLHTITFFNGDDVLWLYSKLEGITIDVIGTLGVDPGTNWLVGAGATSEFTLVRMSGISEGTTDWLINSTQWDVYPQNTFTFLGSHRPCLTLTLTDSLIYDPNSNMMANPADSIRYTMILKNQSGQSLLPTNLTRTGDPNTTYDPNSLKASPLAFNDTFPYDVHPKMVIAGLGLLANDYDLNDPLPNPPFNGNLTVVRVNSMPLGGAITTVGGGSVAVMADGSFSYDSTGTNGATTDFFQYTVLDQDGFYDSAFVLIRFNEPPAIASNIPATDTICAFEQRDTFLMTSAFSISDDGTVIASAKVEICTNYLATEDTLIPGSLPGGITPAWTDGSGTLMLMGNASLADYETAIEGVQYLNKADTPDISIREICITVHDGIANSNQVTRLLKLKPVNDCPVAVRDTVSTHENIDITMFNVLSNDTDLENDPLSVTKINGGMTLSMINITGGTINSLATNGILNFSHTTGFTGLDSLSAGEMFFTRFEYSMSDGSCEDSDSVIIKITGVNDAPLIASNLSATDTICAFEMQDTFLVTAAFTLLDDEDNTDSATISICTNYLNSEDTLLTGALPGGIMTAWNDATGTLKLYGSTTKANYATAIKALQYLNSSNTPNTNTRRICITVHDGDLLSNQVTREMKVKPINDCPVAVRDTVSTHENIDITMFNVLSNDTDLENDPLSVTKINGGMPLSMVNISGGTINSLATNGILNFSHTTGFTGLDSLSAGEEFFTRFEYSLSDGACEDSDSVIIKITGINDAPLIASNLSATDTICAFEMQDTFLVTAAFTLLDDEDNTDSATISLCNNYLNSEDTLITGALPGGIVANWNNATGTLKLYGSSTKANYATAIKAIQYINSNNTPNTNTRRICITVHDGDLLSNQVTRELKVKPVNDCPVAVRDTLFVTENGSTMPGNVLTNDTDPESNVLSVTMVNSSSANSNVVINGGTINIATGGAVTFTHTTGATGLDTLNLNQMFFARAQYMNSDGLCTDNDSVIIKVTGINDAPIADSNKYTLAQTSILTIAAPGILADDDDIDNGSSIIVGEVNGSAANVSSLITLPSGADLTVNANGSFTYNPKCLVAGLDSFTYAAKDEHNALSDTVKVYLQISQTMWFVDDVVTNGSGSFTSPFNTFASVESQSQPGDYIFLFPGIYTQNLILKNDQKLIGADENWFCPSGSTIRTASGTTTFTGELTLAMNDTIKGIDFISNSASPLASLEARSLSGSIFIKDNNASVGNLLMSNNIMTISSTARCGMVFKYGGSLNVTFDNITISGTGQTAFDVNNCNGSLNILAGSASTSGDTLINIKGGQLTATFNNSCTQSGNFPLLTVTDHSVGTLTFQTGNLSATNGTGLQFNNADGSYNINGTTTTLGGGDAGVDILNGSSGLFSFSSSTSITNPSGTAFNVGGASTASITYSGNISDNTGFAIDIDEHDANNITFQTGTINSTGSGIRVQNCGGGTKTFANSTKTLNTGANNAVTLSSNTGATINFTNGGLDIDCTSGTGFTATGGGTVSVQGTGNSILTTTGTALNIANTTISSSNLNFQRIDAGTVASSPANGIVLNTTGSSGALIVSGSGSAGTGGTIQKCATGISLISCTSPSFSYMVVKDCTDDGIFGQTVNNFTMANSSVTNNGNTVNTDCGIDFGTSGSTTPNGVTGTITITNCSLTGNYSNQLYMGHQSGTSSLVMSGCTITGSTDNNNNDGILITPNGTATINANIQNTGFSANKGDHFQLAAANSGNSTIVYQNNTHTGGHPTGLGQGITISAATVVPGYAGTVTYDVNGNTFNSAISNSVAVVLGTSADAALFTGKVRNNIIGTSGVSLSCSSQANGVYIDSRGNGTHTSSVTGNVIRQCFDRGILAESGDGTTPNLDLTVQSNTIDQQVDIMAREAFQTNFGITSTNVFGMVDAPVVCLQFGGAGVLANTLSHGGGVSDDFRLRKRQDATVRLPGYGGGTGQDAASLAQVVAFIQSQNTGSAGEPGSAAASGGGGGYTGGASCVLPALQETQIPNKLIKTEKQ